MSVLCTNDGGRFRPEACKDIHVIASVGRTDNAYSEHDKWYGVIYSIYKIFLRRKIGVPLLADAIMATLDVNLNRALKLQSILEQRFSNYCPLTNCGPSKKYRRRIKIQMAWVSHYSWKSQSLEITPGNRLSLFSQYWHFMKFITLPMYRFPTLLSATMDGFKALWA